ncbi:M16 family metallopeptidase [Methylocystis bryophila]|uniref:Peptidase M16 n=1 Tax=Methylocystis bryophila TaxID=655015 RepID=A0A1W6MQD1_9HYPH|nr:pitrilysin family protein [Methylocystis bryophila]ARN79798.1 peptidase M16 [Methylocystis bryophila]BDV39681.1 peptidase M16 [Methylocystis bryophila]
MTARLSLPRQSSRAETVQRVKAACGVEAWLVESYAVPLVALEFAVGGGASQDPQGKGGLASLLAGLLDEGAGPYDSRAFHRKVEDLAIHLGFGADRDHLSGHFQSLTRTLDEGFELFGFSLNEPRFEAEAVARVRGQLAASIRREANDPDAMVGKAFREAAFPGHAYGRPLRGDLETLERLERDDIEALRGKLFARDNVKIAVVGAIDAATLARKLDAVFGAWPQSPQLEPTPEVAVANVGERRVIELDVPQSTFRFGRGGVAKADPDYFAAVVVNHVLGGGVFSSRLFTEVREKRGLAYSVYSHLQDYRHTAAMFGAAATKNERAGETLGVIEEECRRLAAEGPTPEELDKAKKYLIGSYALRFDTSTKIASQLVRLQLDGDEPSYLDTRNEKIEAVTLDHARAVAKRLLGDGSLLVAVVGKPQGLS